MKGRAPVGACQRRLTPCDDDSSAVNRHFNRLRRDPRQIGDDLDGLGRFEDIHRHAVLGGLGAGTAVEPFEIAVIKEDSSQRPIVTAFARRRAAALAGKRRRGICRISGILDDTNI